MNTPQAAACVEGTPHTSPALVRNQSRLVILPKLILSGGVVITYYLITNFPSRPPHETHLRKKLCKWKISRRGSREDKIKSIEEDYPLENYSLSNGYHAAFEWKMDAYLLQNRIFANVSGNDTVYRPLYWLNLICLFSCFC